MTIDQGLLKSIQDNDKELLTVEIHYSKLTAEDIIQLTQALEKNTYITDVKIIRCELTDDLIKPFLLKMASHPSIKTLDLENNKLSDESAKLLVNFKNLTQISMKENQLTDVGVSLFYENNTLIDVNVKKNNASNPCIKKLLFKIAENKIKSSSNSKRIILNFESLEFNDDDVEKLVNLIKIHVDAPNIELCLKDNNITDKGAAILSGSHLIENIVLVKNPKITANGIRAFFINPSFKNINFFNDYYGDYDDSRQAEDMYLKEIQMLERNDPNNKIIDFGSLCDVDSVKLHGQMYLKALQENKYISCLRMRKHNSNPTFLFQALLSREVPLEEISIAECHALHGVKFESTIASYETPIHALARLIEKNKSSLRRLNLQISDEVKATHPDVKELSTALCKCVNLTELSLTVPEFMFIDIIKNLSSSFPKLESIDFHNQTMDIPVIHSLSYALSRCAYIKKINLAYCSINSAGMQILAPQLSRYNQLEYVNFEGNPLSYNGNKLLVNALSSSAKHLKSLYLFKTENKDEIIDQEITLSNDLTATYSQFLAKASTLQILEIPGLLQPKALLKTLSTMERLTELYLKFCTGREDDQTVIEVADFISKNKTLSKLTLWDSVHEKGGKALEEALKVNFTLQQFLYFRTPSCNAEIDQYLERNRKPSSSAANQSQASSWQPHPFALIPATAIEKGEKIGTGAYGTVYKGNWNGTTVAIKEFRLQTEDEKIKKDFENEIKLLANLNHDHIIAFRGIIQNQRSLVMAYAAGGTLYMLLQDEKIELNWPERLRLAYEIALGVAYLHQCKPTVLHCDLKSANVLLNDSRRVQLSDFGLAKTKNTTSSQTQGGARGTPTHMAPELFSEDANEAKLTTKIDIYSLGIILWELATREIPFKGKNVFQIMKLVTEGKRPDELTNCNSSYKSLVMNCWAQEKMNRFEAQQVVDNLKNQQVTQQTSSPPIPFVAGGFMSMGNS